MAKVELHDLKFYAHHGCFDEERKIGTYFTVDVTFDYDSSVAEQSDNIDDAVNYADVYAVIKEEMQKPSHLLENVAYRIKNALTAKFTAISEACVTVTKLAPPIGGDVREVRVRV